MVVKVKKRFCAVMLTCAVMLSACSSNVTKETEDNFSTSVTIKKDGYIEDKITEEFSKDYYDEAELETMINQSVSEYLKNAPDSKISVKKCKKDKNNVVVEMEYSDYKAYEGFNGQTFFSGTIKEAYEEGYDLNFKLSSVDTETKTVVSKQELLNMGDSHIVIMEINADVQNMQEIEPVYINCYDEILYVGDGVSLSGKKTAKANVTEGMAVVVFK